MLFFIMQITCFFGALLSPTLGFSYLLLLFFGGGGRWGRGVRFNHFQEKLHLQKFNLHFIFLPEKVVENLIKADKIGNKIYSLFINECLIKGKADFFIQFKRLILI